MSDKYYVQIKKFEGDEVVKEMGPFAERKAERVESGAGRNLNHDEYYTLVVEKD